MKRLIRRFFNRSASRIIHDMYWAINNNSYERFCNLNIAKTGIEIQTIKVSRLVPDLEIDNIKSSKKSKNK